MIEPDTKRRSLTSTEENSRATKAPAKLTHNHNGAGGSWITASRAMVATPSTARVPARMVPLRCWVFMVCG